MRAILNSTASSQGSRAQDNRRLRAWIQLAALLLLAAMATPFFAGLVYTHDDLGEFHLPTRDFYATQLSRGEAFDWMPSLYSGFYLTGEGQVGGYHPLHWLLYRTLPLGAAFDLEAILSYPSLFGGTFLLLRRLIGRSTGALFGALAFTFSGFSLLHFVHPNAIAVVAHLPWLLWAIGIALDTSRDATPRRRAIALGGIALLTGSQLLIGYPQYVWLSLVAEVGFCCWRVEKLQGACHAAIELTWIAGAKLCGLAIGAAQVLPTLDMLSGSTRHATDAEFAVSGSLAPLNLAQLVAPYLFQARVVGGNTHELGLYAGAVPLALCVWLLANRASWGRFRPLIKATLALAVVALLMAFGDHTPWGFVQSHLPLVNRFRFPCRAIVLFHLATATAAAIGFALVCRDSRRHDAASEAKKKARVPFLFGLVASSVLLAVLGPIVWPEHVASAWAVWSGPLLVGGAATLLTLATRGKRLALVGLVLLAAIDQGVYGLSYAIGGHVGDLNQFVRSASTPDSPAPSRVAADLPSATSSAPRVGDRMLLAGAQRVDGYAGLEPGKQLDYRSAEALRLAGVEWVLRTPNNEAIPGLLVHDERWLRVPEPLPRARLVTRVATFSQMPRNAANRDTAALNAAIVDRPLDLPGSVPGAARLESDRPGRIVVDTSTSARQLLVVAESFHSGWLASVDGRAAPVVRVDGDFLGCVVEPGEHRVELVFSPQSLRLGKIVSGCGLALMLCLSFVRFRSRR